jgi:hypothetical protein
VIRSAAKCLANDRSITPFSALESGHKHHLRHADTGEAWIEN